MVTSKVPTKPWVPVRSQFYTPYSYRIRVRSQKNETASYKGFVFVKKN